MAILWFVILYQLPKTIHFLLINSSHHVQRLVEVTGTFFYFLLSLPKESCKRLYLIYFIDIGNHSFLCSDYKKGTAVMLVVTGTVIKQMQIPMFWSHKKIKLYLLKALIKERKKNCIKSPHDSYKIARDRQKEKDRTRRQEGCHHQREVWVLILFQIPVCRWDLRPKQPHE